MHRYVSEEDYISCKYITTLIMISDNDNNW